jgi:integrase/recombinase XerD
MAVSNTEGAGKIRRKPALPALDGADLNWLLDEYVASCRARLREPTTAEGYAFKLAWFTRWWADVGPAQDWQLHKADLVQFELWLRNVRSPRTKKTLAYNTRNDVVRRLREALHWAFREGYTDRNYAGWVPRVDGAPLKRKAATVEDLQRLMDAATRSQFGARDRAILAMLMGAGLRRAEVAHLDVGDVVLDADGSGTAHVVGKRTKARAEGERDVAIDAASGRIVGLYLDASGLVEGPLFRGRGGKRLTAMGIYKIVKRLVADAGLEGRIQACHDLRRAFTTWYLRMHRNGGQFSARLLQEQLGHSSFNTTAQYLLTEVEDMRESITSPVGLLAPTRRV